MTRPHLSPFGFAPGSLGRETRVLQGITNPVPWGDGVARRR